MKIMQEIGPHPNVVTILGVCTDQGENIKISKTKQQYLFFFRALFVGYGICDVWKTADPPTRAANEAIFIFQFFQRWRGSGRDSHIQGFEQICLWCG